MRGRQRHLALVAGLFLCGAPVSAANYAGTHFNLSNGLHVILRPVRGAQQTAVVMLFALGGDHDPPGASGLAHLVEHLYVTAAAGEAPARTTEEFVRAYPLGWNAQTGDDYTVFATVVEPTSMNAELRHHAKRMGNLSVTQNDLQRELPRIEQELQNMFGGIPTLAAMNLARERVRPTPLEGRKGGRTESLNKLTPEGLQTRWQKYYKPGNATLVVAGDFDSASVRRSIEAIFTDLPHGRDAPTVQPSPQKKPPADLEAVAVEPVQPGMRSAAAVAYRAPMPGSRDYPPFLCLVARLMRSQGAGATPQPTEPTLRYSFLDDPHVLFVLTELKDGETADAAEDRLRAFVDQAVTALWYPSERAVAKQAVAFFLDTVPMPDHVVAANVYGVAFGAARRHQLKLDGTKLGRQMDRVRPADVQRVVQTYFDHTCGAVVVAEVGR